MIVPKVNHLEVIQTFQKPYFYEKQNENEDSEFILCIN